MAKAAPKKLNQVQALQRLLKQGKSFTCDELRAAVSELTGRNVSENSLRVSVSSARKSGINVKTTHDKATGVRGYTVPRAARAKKAPTAAV